MTGPTILKAHRALADAAEAIVNSAMANPKEMPGTSVNSAIATLCLCVAGQHTTSIQPTQEAEARQKELLELAAPILRNIEDRDWKDVLHGHDQECLSAAQSNGHTEYACIYDQKLMPCLACPHLTKLKPDMHADIARPAEGPNRQAHKPDYPRASAAAVRALQHMARWAPNVPAQHHTTTNAIAAGVALADAAYYAAAAIEVHPLLGRRGNRDGHMAHIRLSEDIYHSLHELMGGWATPLNQPGKPMQHCAVQTWHIAGRTEYVCRHEENWDPNRWDGDTLDNPCNTCDLMKAPPRPRVQELLKRAMDREKTQAAA